MFTREIGPYAVGMRPYPLVVGPFTDDAGRVVDLTDWAAVWTWVREDDQAITGSAPAGIMAPPTDGLVEYAWTGTELDTAGVYTGRMWVGDGVRRLVWPPGYRFVVINAGTPPNI